MRLKLGLAASTMSIASLLVFAAPAAAAPADDPTTTIDAPIDAKAAELVGPVALVWLGLDEPPPAAGVGG